MSYFLYMIGAILRRSVPVLASFLLGIALAVFLFTDYASIFFRNPFRYTILQQQYNSSAKYLIPKICYQTWRTKDPKELTDSTKDLILYNQKLNPDIDFQLWDDKDIEMFLKSEFPLNVFDAFKHINPAYGAAKADFFRYCILFKRGGLWLDIKSSFTTDHVFGKVIKPDDKSVLDIRRTEFEPYREKWNYGTYEQWCLAFSPGHPYLGYMIDRMVRSITSRIAIPLTTEAEGGAPRYPNKVQVLRVTGPDALAVAIHDAIVDHGILHREIDFKYWVIYSKTGKTNPEYKKNKIEHYLTLHDPFYVP